METSTASIETDAFSRLKSWGIDSTVEPYK
jgi:hypothetical protein